jgi:ABC-type uncharacterized transport system substrate-binding protein
MRHWMIAVGLLSAAPGPVLAHPHVFIDAAVEVIFDAEGRAEALRLSWTYDDLFSLLIVEDRGLDPDYDGILTPDAVAALSGFDMQWDADFPGDTYALLSGAELALSRPQDWTASYAEGKITSTHLRRFTTPVAMTADNPLVVQVYDPGFYTAYMLVGQTVLTGRDDCTAQVFVPDRSAADEQLLAALAEMSADTDIEIAFPAIGAAYAEEVRITCAAP